MQADVVPRRAFQLLVIVAGDGARELGEKGARRVFQLGFGNDALACGRELFADPVGQNVRFLLADDIGQTVRFAQVLLQLCSWFPKPATSYSG